MRYDEVRPAAALAPWVRCFWFLTTDKGPVQPVVPDGRLEIVLHRAEPFGEMCADGSMRPQATVVVSGQLTRPLHVGPRGPADIVGIRFRTAGARDVLGLPLGRLTNLVVPLADVDAGLVARLEVAARADDPVANLSRVLLEQVRPRRHEETATIVRWLERGATVHETARALGRSVRSIERHVLDDTGLPPRTLQQIVRFRRLYGLLQSGAGAGAAAAAGYYDQSHAGRAFRRFAGVSPRTHFARQPSLARALLSHSS